MSIIKLYGVNMFAVFAYSLVVEELAALSEESRKGALERFRLLAPHLEQGRPLRAVAAEAGIPFRTAQRWVERYREFGLAALARKKRADQGTRRVVSPRLKEAIEGLALESPPIPTTALYRQLQRIAQAIGEPVPSYPVVYRVTRELPVPLLTLAHQGGKVYSEAFDLIHRREAAGPNAIWQVDHELLDILVLREEGSPAKPWLTIVIDDYSRAIAGYYLSFDPPSSLRTSLALRQGIWRKDDPRWPVSGIPEVLYTDNGSDFTSHHLEQVAADLKIRLIFSIPGKPRGRGRIERFFRTVNQMFLSDLDTAVGSSRGKPTFTLAQLDRQFHSFLLDVYHRRTSAGTGKPPMERWEAEGFLPRMPQSLEQLDLLLICSARIRKIRPDGIHFQGLRYLSATLAAYVGEDVMLRFDPRDMGEVRVFHRDRFLCRAVSADLAGNTIPLREIVRARNRRRKELRTVIDNRQQAVDTLLAMKRGPVSEEAHATPSISKQTTDTVLKRYRNE